MHSWTTIIVLVVVFGFAVEFRPLDHFMTEYLTGPPLNITTTQVNIKLTIILKNKKKLGIEYRMITRILKQPSLENI